MDTGLIIIDNFYDDPDSMRDLALSCEYFPEKTSKSYPNGNAPWPGKMSKASHSPDNVDAIVSKLLHKNMRRAGQDSGMFRISQQTSDVGMFDNMIHADGHNDNYYAGVLYLSKDQEATPGTLFYKQNSTGLDRLIDDAHLKDIILKNEDKDVDKWTAHTVSNIVYNRLLIYPEYKFHGIGPCFGTTDDNARIIQLFNWIDIK